MDFLDLKKLILVLVLSSPIIFIQPVSGSSHGNQLNPANQPPGLTTNTAAFNIFQENLRTPSGILYGDVMKWPELKPLGETSWKYSLSLEAGYLGATGDTGSAAFREYGDWSEGLILNRFRSIAENEETAQYIKVHGGGVGRDDQYLEFATGKYGNYDISIAYDSTPHLFTTNAHVLWQGIGTNNLTLPNNLTPGLNTTAEILNAFQSINPSTLALERDKLSVSFNVDSLKQLKLFADGSIEWREGTRPFGGAFTYPTLGQVAETVEPVDYLTHTINLGFSYSGSTYQANLSYAGSFFRNNNKTLIWDNPGLFFTTPPANVILTPEQGQFALAPDNNSHNIRGDLATTLPFWNSRLTVSASYNVSSQNDSLVPPTINTGLIGNPGRTINLDQWNTLNALSSRTADAEIESLDLHSKVTMRPITKLNLIGELRYRDQDNKTDYTAFNPLTGEYGYLALDGGLGGPFPSLSTIFDPTRPGDRVRFRSIPFDKDTLLVSAGANYRLSNKTKIFTSYEREEMHYSHREVDEVVDNRYKLQLSHRKIGLGTLRFSYEFSDRNTDDYNFNPYEPFYTSSLPNFISRFTDGNEPHTLSALRKYDLAEKDTHSISLKFNAIIRDNMDIMVTGSYVDEDYDADFGLNYTESVTANIEWNYQFALNGSLYAYYSFQSDERRLTNINDAGPRAADPDPGGPVYPLDNLWSEKISEKNHSIGSGLNISLGEITINLDYSYLHSDGKFNYSFASPAAILGSPALQEVADGFPDQTFTYHLFEGNAKWQVRENINLNFLYRYERENLDDFHYNGLTEPVVGNDIYLLTIPENYKTHIFMFTVETSF